MRVHELLLPIILSLLTARLTIAETIAFSAPSSLRHNHGWVSRFPRGGSSDYAAQCELVKNSILSKCQKEVCTCLHACMILRDKKHHINLSSFIFFATPYHVG